VLDVFGNGKTAVKHSVNRYNQIRTTGIAANYNPLLSQTATLPWRDANGNDIRRGRTRLHRLSAASAARSTSRRCRRTSASPRSTNSATTRAPGISRTFELQQQAAGPVGVHGVLPRRLPQP
jgi:hypothetical protein